VSPEEAVRARLLEIPDVVALVGVRIYMLKLPQAPTLPALRVQPISDLDNGHLRGAAGTGQARIQIDAYVDDRAPNPYNTTVALANAIAGDGAGSGLSGWRGDIAGVRVTGIARLDRDATYEAGELRLLRMRQDFRVWWRPAANDLHEWSTQWLI
jgi:Protein of unknown function (DUF3168)